MQELEQATRKAQVVIQRFKNHAAKQIKELEDLVKATETTVTKMKATRETERTLDINKREKLGFAKMRKAHS